jgi:signal transduction histidine kinase
MTIRLQLLIGCFVLILVFVVVFFANQRLSQQVLTNTTYLNNSEAVIRNSNILHKEMIEMQSGFRGFLLTNQEPFLQSYYDGLISVPPLIKEQRSLLSTENQKEKLDSVYTLHKEWVAYADSLISSKKDTLPESGKRYQRLFDKKLKMEVGKKLNDKIHSLFIIIDNYEYDLRLERRRSLQKSIKATRDISIALIVATILLSLILSFYFIRSIINRISKMVTFAERISKGDFITITDKKRDEFNKLINSLNQMSEGLDKGFKELTKKNKELDQFAYVVSHDLKAPLRGISNIIGWIEEDHAQNLTPEIDNNLILIKGRILRLENMINGLLDYAKIGKIKKGLNDVDVNALILDLKELILPPTISLLIEDKLPVIKAEKLSIEQVFSNLLSNAVKYNDKKNPKVIIRYKDAGDFYEFSVSDNGPGIESKYFGKIFEIFQTLQERDAFESTGVGLAIVKKIIEENQGTIHVESTIGEGSTFIFTWPKHIDKK